MEGSGCDLILRYYPSMYGKPEKDHEKSITLAGLRAEI
jgi:hypothetical protein